MSLTAFVQHSNVSILTCRCGSASHRALFQGFAHAATHRLLSCWVSIVLFLARSDAGVGDGMLMGDILVNNSGDFGAKYSIKLIK